MKSHKVKSRKLKYRLHVRLHMSFTPYLTLVTRCILSLAFYLLRKKKKEFKNYFVMMIYISIYLIFLIFVPHRFSRIDSSNLLFVYSTMFSKAKDKGNKEGNERGCGPQVCTITRKCL